MSDARAAVTRLVSQHRWTYYTAHSTRIVSSDRCLGPRRRWLARAGSMISPIESFGPRVEYYKYVCVCVCVRIFIFLRSTRTYRIRDDWKKKHNVKNNNNNNTHDSAYIYMYIGRYYISYCDGLYEHAENMAYYWFTRSL